jgi:hexosaminidase
VEGILKNYVLKTTPDNRYRHPKKLFDGVIGGINFRDGHWNGFIRTKDYVKGINERNSGDLVLEIDLSDKKYSSIGFHSLESLGEYIMFPESIELYDISQNKNKLIYSKKLPKSSLGSPNITKFFKVPIFENPSKVKLVVKSNKKLPKGHPAEGEYAWLFVDEVLFL